ncbi:hypothetical protein WA158_008417 [Blastocystis sp. Blastoise]
MTPFIVQYLYTQLQFNQAFLLYYYIECICLLFPISIPLLQSLSLLSSSDYQCYLHQYSTIQFNIDISSMTIHLSPTKKENFLSFNYQYMPYLLLISNLSSFEISCFYTLYNYFYTYYLSSSYLYNYDLFLSILSCVWIRFHKDKFLITNIPNNYLDMYSHLPMVNPMILPSKTIIDKYQLILYMQQNTVDPINNQRLSWDTIYYDYQLRNTLFSFYKQLSI